MLFAYLPQISQKYSLRTSLENLGKKKKLYLEAINLFPDEGIYFFTYKIINSFLLYKC